MSGNLSVTAANLQGWVIYVQSANDQLERAAAQIVARYGALAPTLSQAGLSGELGWRGEILETLRAAHYEKELAYAAEAADDPAAREELDEATASMRALLIGSRQMFAGNFGQAAALDAGLAERTPEGGVLLVAFSENFIKALRVTPQRASLYGAIIDLTGNINSLDAALARLRAAQDAHNREARELQGAKLERDRAQEALRAAYVQIATYYESIFRMAGLDELADRLRPTARRASSVEPPPVQPIADAP
jgi:hypothetical protein